MIVRIGEIDVGYDDDGTGEALVLVHGFPHDRTLWAPQVGALAARARCIAPDLRGFGETPAAPPFSVDQYADDVAALLDNLGVERAVVGGLSMGGYVTLAFWRRHRHRVRGLVLADTRAAADTEQARAKRRELITVAETRGAAAVAEAMMTGMVGRTTRRRHPELVRAVQAMLASASVDGIVGALGALMARADARSLLPTIDVPTLIVVGDEDALAPVDEARAMHEAIAGSRLEVLARAGHVSNLERPAAFNRVLTEFLDSL